MFSVRRAKRSHVDEGWSWVSDQPDRAASITPATGIVTGIITLLVLGWFAWPADAARRFDDAAVMPTETLLAWTRPLSRIPAPSATLVELAQKEGGDVMVPPVKRQQPQTPSAAPVQQPTAAQPSAEKPKPEATQEAARPPEAAPTASSGFRMPDLGSIFAPVTDWLAKANREYQGTIVKELSKPSPQEQEAETRRLAEEKAAAEKEAAARAAEAAKLAAAEEAKRKAEKEAARKAAEAAKDAEAKKQADAAKQAESTKKPETAQADAQKETEARKQAEAQKQAEAKKAADAEAEARRLREAARLAEEKKQEQLKLEQARKEEAEAARKAKLAEERKTKDAAQTQETIARPAAGTGEPAHQRHRRWTVTIIPEPIERPSAEPVSSSVEARLPRVREANAVLLGAHQLSGRMSLGAGNVRGTAVKRWVWRAGTCRFAGRKVHKNDRYTVARGDSLWRISEKHYDDGGKYPRIYRANRDRISDPDLIYPCQRFRVPKR